MVEKILKSTYIIRCSSIKNIRINLVYYTNVDRLGSAQVTFVSYMLHQRNSGDF